MNHQLDQKLGVSVVAISVVTLRWTAFPIARCIPANQCELIFIKTFKLTVKL